MCLTCSCQGLEKLKEKCVSSYTCDMELPLISPISSSQSTTLYAPRHTASDHCMLRDLKKQHGADNHAHSQAVVTQAMTADSLKHLKKGGCELYLVTRGQQKDVLSRCLRPPQLESLAVAAAAAAVPHHMQQRLVQSAPGAQQTPAACSLCTGCRLLQLAELLQLESPKCPNGPAIDTKPNMRPFGIVVTHCHWACTPMLEHA